MSFEWKEYLALSKYIASRTHTSFSSEAAARCAVSRSYYAVFCYTRNYARDNLKPKFIPGYNPDDHWRLREHLEELGKLYKDSTFIMVAANLDDLRQKRNSCDYDDDIYAPILTQDWALNAATDILEILD